MVKPIAFNKSPSTRTITALFLAWSLFKMLVHVMDQLWVWAAVYGVLAAGAVTALLRMKPDPALSLTDAGIRIRQNPFQAPRFIKWEDISSVERLDASHVALVTVTGRLKVSISFLNYKDRKAFLAALDAYVQAKGRH
jgi:hypothetical protein